VSKADKIVDKGAEGLQSLSERAAASGGVAAKAAPTLADDAAFVRKLKPSLIAARARGEAPTDEQPGEGVVVPSPPPKTQRRKRKRRGPNPWLVIGAAFALGVIAAKVVDWRSHAHPHI
jgi:hypothetical protein